jgi:hypothetical protein
MSRTVSNTLWAAAGKNETEECPIILLTFEHDDLDSPVRLTSDSTDTTSNGVTFTSKPFEIQLPDDTEDTPPATKISVAAVDRDLTRKLVSVSTPPTVTIQLVLSSDPDTVEAEWTDFELRSVSYNSLIISGEITIANFSEQLYPGIKFTPNAFPGVFRT